MSYDLVKSLSIVKRKDGYTFKGSFAANNVVPLYYTSHESSHRWKTREEVDTVLAWEFWNGNLQRGQSEWAVRDDIARLLSKRAEVKHLPVSEWKDDDDTHRYGSPVAVMENTIFPAARDLYNHWKTTAGKYAIVDDDCGFVYKITSRRHSTTIRRTGSPIYWTSIKTLGLACKIALDKFNREFRVVSEADVSNAEQAIAAEREDDHIPSYILARRLFDNARPLFDPQWEYAVKRFPALLTNGEVVKQVAA